MAKYEDAVKKGLKGKYGASDYDQAVKTGISGLRSNVDDDYIKSYTDFYNSNFGNAHSDLGKVNYGNSKQTLDSYTNKYGELNSRYSNIRGYLNSNKANMDEDTFNKVYSMINDTRDNASKITGAFRDRNNYFSRWQTQEDYDKYVEDQNTYNRRLNMDLGAENAEVQRLSDLYEGAKKSLSESKYRVKYDDYYVKYITEGYGKNAAAQLAKRDYDRDSAKLDSRDYIGESGYSSIDDLGNAISEKKKDIFEATKIQNRVGYENEAKNAPDFAEMSAKGASVKNPSVRDASGINIIGNVRLGATPVENIVTYTRDNTDFINNELSSGRKNYVGDLKYNNMTDEEVSIYNYYIGKGDKEKASAYLDSIYDDLTRREAYKDFDRLKDNTGLELAFSVVAGVDQFKSGVSSLFGDTQTSTDQYVSGMVREDLAEKSSLSKVMYDAGTSITNMLPSVLVGALTHPAIGAATMGASAAGNAYSEMINMGYDKDQAKTYSVLVGISETSLEYLIGGIAGVSGGVARKAISKVAPALDRAIGEIAVKYGNKELVKFLGEMASEGIEESVQEVLEPVMRNIIFNENTNDVDIHDVLYSGLLGAISAGVINGAVSAPTAIANKIHNRNNITGDNANVLSESNPYEEQVSSVKDNIERVTKDKREPVTPAFEKEEEAQEPKKVVSVDEAFNSVSTKNIDDSSLQQIKSEYDGSISAEEFAKGMSDGFNYGYTGVPRSAIENTTFYSMLNDMQKDHSYQLGVNAAKAKADARKAEIAIGYNGKTGRKRGIVKSEGVSLKDLKSKFNDTQNKAYKILADIADATGFDIVLYNSEANENGVFEGNQGQYNKKTNEIKIDINAGLLKSADVNDLGKYTMLRTFCHEFTHAGENWNPGEYDVLRKMVFEELNNRGENPNDLIELKMAKNDSLSYDKASREVVAEAMTDILPDSNFIKNIAENNKSLFDKLYAKIKEFINSIKAYFNSIGHNRSREANALKEEREGELHYLESIIEQFDRMAEGAVENYQLSFAIDEEVNTNTKEDTKTSEKSEVSENDTKKAEVEENTAEEVSTPEEKTEKKESTAAEREYTDAEKTAIAEAMKENMGHADSVFPDEIHDGIQTDRNTVETTTEPVVSETEAPAKEIKPVDPIIKKIVKFADTKFLRLAKANIDGKTFFGTEHFLHTVSDDALSSIDLSIININGQSLESIKEMIKRADTKINGPAYKNNDRIVFDLPDSKWQVALDEKYAKMFDGNDFYYNPTAPSTDIVVKDKAGDIVGIILPIKPKEKIVFKDLPLSNMKSFKVKKEAIKNGSTENENNTERVRTPDTDGKRDSRLLDEVEAGSVRGDVSGRKSVDVPAEEGEGTPRVSDRLDAERNGSGRSNGSSESGDLRRNGELSEEKNKELHETVDREIEQKSTENPKGNNFVIDESLNLPIGEKNRFRANIDAIKLVKQLEAEGRYATPEEQQILSKYVGWGGLSNAFGEMRWNSQSRKSEMVAKNGWEAEFAEFRKLVEDGVITEQEYNDASASTKNAHYTSVEVIKAMYDGLSYLGFNGGRMLEPSSGVGNFVGGMPVGMSSKVNSWTMVELDSITGNIAKYLYPNSDVRVEGFEKANIPNNYMDVAIGNVPFGNYGVVDRTYPKRITKAIHNYFFAKSIDKVRPGGLVMFITSSFTMNGKNNDIRQYIMDRADLIGAIRLPNTAFAGNAGTQVVTDILILKKREAGTPYTGEAFLEAPMEKVVEGNWQTANVNEYFINHPEMVLGTPAFARGMYGPESLTYNPLEGKGSLGDQIRGAFKNINQKMDYKAKVTPEKANFNAQRADKKVKNNGLIVNEDGSISRNNNGTIEKFDADAATSKRISGMLKIRDAYKTLINYLQQGQAENLVKKARKDLNDAYDSFVKEHGFINNPKNKSAIDVDPDSYSICALENYDAKKKTATKADIFTKNTITANRTITHVDDIESGVIVSINTTGGVDADLIAKLTERTVDDVTRELIDSRSAFKTRDGMLESPEVYLSGNVRAKLREAEALAKFDPDYNNNVEELKKVIPEDIPFNDIYVTPGSPWIPNEVYADFIAEMLGGRNNPDSYRGPDVTVGRTNTGEFKISINDPRLKSRYQNTQQYGTNRRTFIDIISAMMSSTSLTVNDYIETESGSKKAVINKVETAAVQEKAEAIAKEFNDWLWKEEDRKNNLTSLYNETYNAFATPKYNGSNLTVNGIAPDFTLREHQSNAVQRIISSGGNTLLAHKVGAGKTLEMASAAMKLRELGIVKKPVFVVPKSLVAQWGVEFKKYFPASKLLVSDDNSFTKANRKIFTNKIANGDYDAVIISYEQFEKVPMSAEYQKRFYQEQIDEIIAAIAEEKAESGKGLTVKDMEKRKAQLEKKIAELTTKSKDEDNIDFEQLGIDSLFVDEAHNFKNLQYTTRMNNISGLGNTNGSQRAFDLYTKVRYLQGLNGGRGVVFATATPVMNSMAEMYIMQKYLQSDMLNQLGLRTFDAWAKQFGEIVNAVEIKPSGQGFRVKQTFSNFKNLNELQLLFRSFSDVLTNIPGLKIPKMKGGKVQVVKCEPGQFQKNFMADLEKRADNIKNVDPKDDNMLKITSDGRKISYTQRMIDPTLPYEPGCKIFKCCENVVSEYKASKSIKGTQIVFCDMATPKGKSKTETTKADGVDIESVDEDSAKLYDDMRSYLVKNGIPAKEIAFIHEANTDQKRKQLFEDVNEGKIRVLIGSTGKMGVGMNAQKRIVAIHHLDAPWRPGDVEQRDGRAFRQGNINEEVTKYTYVTEGSFDARLWDILDRKQHFINQIMNGEDVGRTAEDTGDVTLSAAEVKAIASGNPLIMEQVQLTNDISKLEDLQKAFNSSVTKAKAKITEDTNKIAAVTKTIENAKEDIKSRVDTYSEGKFSMTIGGKKFTDKKDAGAVLVEAIRAKANVDGYVTVGSFAGFEIRAIKKDAEYFGKLVGKNGYDFSVYMTNTTMMINKICEIPKTLEDYVKVLEGRLEETKMDLVAQQKMSEEKFAKREELEEKRKRFNEIMAILNPAEEQTVSDDDTQYQERTGALTDREVLEIASDNIKVSDLTDGEKAALDIFKNRLTKLNDLQTEREEQGRLYKEQQFGSNVNRAAAKETLNRMHILDNKIKNASSELLSVEEKEVLKQVLKKSRYVIEQEERRRGYETLKRWRENRKNADAIKKYRERIKTDVKDLSDWIIRPDNKDAVKRVPDVVKNSVIPFLTSIDFTSKRQLRGKEATIADKAFEKNIIALKSAIKENIDANGIYSGYNDLPVDFMDNLQEFIDLIHNYVNENSGEFVINKMTGAELRDLAHIVHTLKRYIMQMNVFHSNAVFSHVYDAGNNTMATLRGIGDAGTKVGEATNFLMWQQMKPAYAFERFGEGGRAIYDELRNAQGTLAFNAKKIIDFTNETYTDKEVKECEENYKEFVLGGDKVRIPISYMMSFYELSKQPDSLRHILGEGVRVATYKDGKSTISDNGHVITEDDIKDITDALTPRQKEIADALQKYMATQGAAWGNYVSIKRFGEEMFTNPKYFPINSDGRHLESTAEEAPSNASLYALLNMSFTKKRNDAADNRIILYSIFDVFANHMASMAQYNAFALPILDSLKWLNYKTSVIDDSTGKRVVTGSVREELSRVYGVPEESRPGRGREGYAESFIKNIIRAYNGTEAQGVPTDSLGIKALRQYNMAQIAYNLRVVVQQPMSITRAGLIIDYSSILKGLKQSPKQIKENAEEMVKYSGIAAWKSLGFYDINISRGLTETIKHKRTVLDKVNEIGMIGAEKADEITWSSMWNACKYEVSNKYRNLVPGTEEYFKKVSELFEEVVYKTQVVDSVLTKNEFMRSKGYFARAISSFMSEPVTTISSLTSAYFNYKTDLQKGMSRSEAWQKNGKTIARTCAVYSVSAIMLAAVQSAIDGLRDNDDEPYGEKYLYAFTGNVIDDLMPFNKLPILSDFYDIAKELVSIFGVDTYGNPPQTIIAQWYNSLIKGTEIMYTKLSGKNTGYTWYASISKLLQAASGITGLPLSPATREVVTIWNNTVGVIDERLKVKTYEKKSKKTE